MKNLINSFRFIKKINLLDRLIFILISLIPLSLAVSIFFADLVASFAGIILLLIFFLNKENDRKIIFLLKKEIILFSILYLIIILSFLWNNHKTFSFLPSIFYFRYFLLTLALFYVFYKHDFLFKKFITLFLISFVIIIIDSYFQLLFDYNLLGYKITTFEATGKHITGFFNDEKKLGSYLIRNLPLLVCLILLNSNKQNDLIEIVVILLISVLIFYTSERTALSLLIIFCFIYFFVSKFKLIFVSVFILLITSLLTLNDEFRYKYLDYTKMQSGLIFLEKNKKSTKQQELSKEWFKNEKIRFFSYEHENLAYTGLKIFEKNILLGTSVKSFHHSCKNLRKKYGELTNDRQNKFLCSTHPHNLFIQILAEIGIFGFIIISSVFFYFLYQIIKLIFKKQLQNNQKAIVMSNLCIIINLMPFLPSGSFFNNWISLILYFSIGICLLINKKFQ